MCSPGDRIHPLLNYHQKNCSTVSGAGISPPGLQPYATQPQIMHPYTQELKICGHTATTYFVHLFRPVLCSQSHRGGKGRGETARECLCPLRWSVHLNLARDGYKESTCCCVQARFLGIETKLVCYSWKYSCYLVM
jgi:hypothetical protein